MEETTYGINDPWFKITTSLKVSSAFPPSLSYNTQEVEQESICVINPISILGVSWMSPVTSKLGLRWW